MHTNMTILLKVISGSRAYGLATATSDTDIKGVFAASRNGFFGLSYPQQINEDNNNSAMYEIGRFTELCLKNNPTALELLATPSDCILEQHPLFTSLTPEIFLSKRCEDTFAGYAASQIKKARGLNKKIVNPMSAERKSLLDFCYILSAHHSVRLVDFLAQNHWKQEECGLVSIDHCSNLYALYHSPEALFSGILRGDDSNDVALSSVPKDCPIVAYLSFNKDGYSRYCKDWKEYQQWLSLRNEERYHSTIEHGKNYDAKNMMHVFRLLEMAYEIATERTINVRRNNREELLAIRSGRYTYEDLLSMADDKLLSIHDAFKRSDLPDEPNAGAVEQLLIDLRVNVYSL